MLKNFSDNATDSTSFIEFMLSLLLKLFGKRKKVTVKVTVKLEMFMDAIGMSIVLKLLY